MGLRILSYNIRYGGTGRESLLAAVIGAAAPDVVIENPRLSAPRGGYVFVPVDWLSNPEAARMVHYAAQQEYALDATAHGLAAQIAEMSARDPRRAAQVERLRGVLDDAFSLMQDNTLREIELLEAELRLARRAHDRRDRYRAQIVNLRLQQLLAE